MPPPTQAPSLSHLPLPHFPLPSSAPPAASRFFSPLSSECPKHVLPWKLFESLRKIGPLFRGQKKESSNGQNYIHWRILFSCQTPFFPLGLGVRSLFPKSVLAKRKEKAFFLSKRQCYFFDAICLSEHWGDYFLISTQEKITVLLSNSLWTLILDGTRAGQIGFLGSFGICLWGWMVDGGVWKRMTAADRGWGRGSSPPKYTCFPMNACVSKFCLNAS